MKTFLKDAKNGDKVSFDYYGTKIIGTVFMPENGSLTLMVWGPDKPLNYPSWNIENQRGYDASLRNIPKEYTEAYWFENSKPCKIIKPPVKTPLAFLAGCIVAGAGMSRFTSDRLLEKANQNKIQSSSRS